MKKNIQTLLIIILFTSSVFAHDKKISANGVTVPDWMMNSVVIGTEKIFDNPKRIGDFLGIPAENTKIKKIIINGNNLHLEYFMGEKASESVMDADFDFVCAKMGDGGTTYISHIRVASRLTFEEKELSCKSPQDKYKYGQCLGAFTRTSEIMFVDEELLAKKQAEEEEQKAEQRKDDYITTFSEAVQSGAINLGIDFKKIKYKAPGALVKTYFGTNNIKLLIENEDEYMTKLGFQKNDEITNVSGLYIFQNCTNFEEFSSLVFLANEGQPFTVYLDREYFNSLPIPEAINGKELIFKVKRKGKLFDITVPAFNKEQVNAFNEKFEAKWK